MRICFVTPYSPKIVGGVGTFVRNIGYYLEKTGINYVVLTKYIDDQNNFSNQIYEIPVSRTRYLRGFELSIKMILFLVQNRGKFDIIHLQTSNHILAPIVIISKFLGIPTLTTIHGKMPYGKAFPFKQFSIIGEWVILNFSDQIIYVSQDTYNYYGGKKGIVILNGVDVDKFRMNEEKRNNMRAKYNVKNSFVILFVGRLTFTKGIYELLEALGKLKIIISTDFRLVNVGITKEQNIDKYLEFVERLDLKQNVINVQQQEDIDGFYNMSDLFILPTYTEGMPFALLEAMASNMVVIASDVGDIDAVIEHEKNGLLIKPKNTDDILEKLTLCINNEGIREKLGKNARTTIKRKFNLEQMVEKYIKIYKKLVARKIKQVRG